MQRITIIGTGLIGTSVGLALRRAASATKDAASYGGEILVYDAKPAEAEAALRMGAASIALGDEKSAVTAAAESDVVVLATPVFAILDWMEKLAPVMQAGKLVTDTGSTKLEIATTAARLFRGKSAAFLPGHPMAGKEQGGAKLGEATLFQGAMWLFTPNQGEPSEIEIEWRGMVKGFGCRTMDLDAGRHDRLCAWASHMPQMVATAMSALLEDEFAESGAQVREEFRAIGGRALREMTRLGSSPYSMWRDVALTNTAPLAETLLALEQRLAHLRENLKTAELREEFTRANKFRTATESGAIQQ